VATSNSQGKSELRRELGLFDSTMVMMGIVIGSGIFVTTGIMAEYLPSKGWLLLAWLAGGLITLTGALTFAELGAAMPEAGGQYVYLREAYGSLFGFLFGWIVFSVYMTGGIAALAVAFAEYFGAIFPSLSTQSVIASVNLPFGIGIFSLAAGQLVAVAAILLLSGCNYIGLVLGKAIQNIFTVAKIGTILALAFFGFTIGRGRPLELDFVPIGADLTAGQLLIGFGLALVAVSWAFDGWNNINFVSGEIKNPSRTIPRALIFGALCITLLYVLTNLVYFYALPIQEIRGVVRIAEKSSAALFGGPGAAAVTAAVMISIVGALNGSILAAPRVYFAMAQDRLFFRRVAGIHPRFRTPSFAIVIQALWASVLALSGTFEQIVTFVMFISIFFWIATAASALVLRQKRPDLERPYKMLGYPVTPIVFILASTGILINTLLEKPTESLAGIGLALLGIPLYYYWQRQAKHP
jgi:APA family basic amino acid/polyamine antiporter